MNLRFTYRVAAGLLALALSACETMPPPKPVERPAEMLGREEVARSLLARQESIHDVKSLVKTRISTPEENHSFKQVVVIEGDASLRMDILSLFNQPLGILISREGELLLYDTDSQKLYRDEEVWDIMIRIFGTAIDFREYIQVFTGRIPRLETLARQEMRWDSTTGNYHLEGEDPESGDRLEIQVDPKTLLPVRLARRHGEKELYQAQWEKYEPAGGIQFPHRITVELPEAGDAVVIKFNEPLVNQGIEPGTFELPVPGSD